MGNLPAKFENDAPKPVSFKNKQTKQAIVWNEFRWRKSYQSGRVIWEPENMRNFGEIRGEY